MFNNLSINSKSMCTKRSLVTRFLDIIPPKKNPQRIRSVSSGPQSSTRIFEKLRCSFFVTISLNWRMVTIFTRHSNRWITCIELYTCWKVKPARLIIISAGELATISAGSTSHQLRLIFYIIFNYIYNYMWIIYIYVCVCSWLYSYTQKDGTVTHILQYVLFI